MERLLPGEAVKVAVAAFVVVAVAVLVCDVVEGSGVGGARGVCSESRSRQRAAWGARRGPGAMGVEAGGG